MVVRATVQLGRLYRFRNAITKTTLHTYKTLIRPIISFSPLALSLTAKTRQRYLQIIQNRALRWYYRIHWQDFATNESLHTLANVPPVTIYHHHLADKLIHQLTDALQQYTDKFNDMTPSRIQHAEPVSQRLTTTTRPRNKLTCTHKYSNFIDSPVR